MRLAAAAFLAVVWLLYAVPAVAAPPTWQAAPRVSRAHGEGRLGFRPAGAADASPIPTPSPSPVVSPSPKPRAPQSPAAFLAIIVTLAVLGAGGLAVLRARWR